jgi:hypothetical protein
MKERLKRAVEDPDVVDRAAQNGTQRVPDGALVGDGGHLERVCRVVELSRSDTKPVLATEYGAERGQVLWQARERVHHEPGRDTEPNPKSVSTL